MSDTKEKLPSANGPDAGFKGIRSGTEQNIGGTTKVEIGTPGKAQRQMRAIDRSGEMSTSRNPNKAINPPKDKSPYEKGETKNTFHPGHGR